MHLLNPLRWALLASAVLADDGCWTNNCTDPIEVSPAPWTLRGTAWAIPLAPVLLGPLPKKAYHPLERAEGSPATAGVYAGVIGAVQIIRYSYTPVGPYDELVLIPGAFAYSGPVRGLPQTDLRVTRMYVSQKYTCYNGRVNWNIPKHLARFDWSTNTDGSTTLKVFPHDTTGDATEATPATQPFFQARILAGGVEPGLPIDLASPLLPQGFPARLNQPPLPRGNGSYGELPGTDRWANTPLAIRSATPGVALVDMDQGVGDAVDGKVNAVGDEVYHNFWPTMPRWNVAVKLDDFTINFDAPTTWTR